MSRAHKLVNLAGIVLPLLGFLLALWSLWGSWVGPAELTLLALGYALTGLGITVGFHRLFTHRSFQTVRPLRYLFAVLGSMAVEGDLLAWVADHRKHHQFSDQPGDPHSPHAGRGEGWRDAVAGLWHAHLGWLLSHEGRAAKQRYCPDLLQDRGLVLIARAFLPLVALSLLLPALAGWLWLGGWRGALGGLLWGGAVRIFLLHHVTFAINSLCHFFGRRRFLSGDESRNVWWLALASFGESWHNNHHAFPTSAFHGLRGRELDPGGWLIRGLARLGLAWAVKQPSPEQQQRRLR